jgi:hypothetical protein
MRMSSGIERIGFFTPVKFDQYKCQNDKLLEAVDGYFCLGDRKAFVLPLQSRAHCDRVIIKNESQDFSKKWIFNAFKIISYITLIFPMIMLLAKIILRWDRQFCLVSDLKTKSDEKQRICLFGDIHGELDGFKENLRAANIIDANGDWKKGVCAHVIQMGDVIDRGPKSVEAYQYLCKLQEQAPSQGGKVIRLLGNHELMVLEKDYSFVNFANPEQLSEKMKKDILSKKLQLAYCDGTRLYTHAGMRTQIKELLIEEIRQKYPLRDRVDDQVSLQEIADYLNELLIIAVRENDFTHPVFRAGRSRGGKFPIGGVLWEDVSQMMQSKNARDVPQIIAHNPPLYAKDRPIRITDSMRLINVDAGLCKRYGGHNAFVEIQNGNCTIHEKVDSVWRETILSDRIDVA